MYNLALEISFELRDKLKETASSKGLTMAAYVRMLIIENTKPTNV